MIDYEYYEKSKWHSARFLDHTQSYGQIQRRSRQLARIIVNKLVAKLKLAKRKLAKRKLAKQILAELERTERLIENISEMMKTKFYDFTKVRDVQGERYCEEEVKFYFMHLEQKRKILRLLRKNKKILKFFKENKEIFKSLRGYKEILRLLKENQ